MALTPDQADLILAKNLENIVKKAASGKPLTPREQQLISQFASPKSSLENLPTPNPEWVSSDAQLAAIFGPHRASFPRFRKRHLDAPQPRTNGDHSVPAWRKFFEQHPDLLSKAAEKHVLNDLDLKRAIESEKLRERKFKNDLREGQYLPKAPTLTAARDLAELLKSKLRSALEDELPPLLQNQPAPIIRTHMKELVDRLCRDFHEASL